MTLEKTRTATKDNVNSPKKRRYPETPTAVITSNQVQVHNTRSFSFTTLYYNLKLLYFQIFFPFKSLVETTAV